LNPVKNTTIIYTGLAILLSFLLNSCKPIDYEGNSHLANLIPSINDWSFSEKIDTFLIRQKKAIPVFDSGFSKNTYLQIIEGQVRVFHQYQNESGRIIDPVEKIEMYFTTPCYAHSVAVLAASGYSRDRNLIESGMLAMDVISEDMSKNWSAGSHGDFYTWPVMLALDLYKGIADDERHKLWSKNIAMMKADTFYRAYLRYGNNWNVVNLAGEFLRYKNNYTSLDYVDTCLKYQLSHFSDHGMYDENGDPLPYDLFARHYISGMLALGYHGTYYEQYKEKAWKGAWMSLFLQSPFGEMPTGFRSSHHIWNEAEQCMVFEIYAAAYAKAGKKEIAGAFKRGAILSLGNIMEWIRPDGSGYVVKNKYPIEAKHGYESYSVHSCYNMLATSMLAQAWQFSDDAISAKAAPADIGGYVVSIHDPFHKIIASADQSYLEYDTRGDQIYNPTGILRIHILGSHPQLGPSDGCAMKYSGEGISIATGPSWQESDGTWSSLAEMMPDDPIIEIIDESAEIVQFRVTYNIKHSKEKSIKVIETIKVERGSITIEDELIGDITKMKVTWPMLTFNGKISTNIKIDKKTAILELEGQQIKFQVIEPENVSLLRSGNQYEHRNGIIEPLVAEFQGNKATYSISIIR
jgi:hypothetical protein